MIIIVTVRDEDDQERTFSEEKVILQYKATLGGRSIEIERTNDDGIAVFHLDDCSVDTREEVTFEVRNVDYGPYEVEDGDDNIFTISI
jgi:hypothetical protein